METTGLQLDFEENFDPERIKPEKFIYTSKVTNTDHWELMINREGLVYTDKSACYNPMQNHKTAQQFSDFWFNGPLLPIPELETRKALLENIQGAFKNPNATSYNTHFQLFEYPKSIDPPGWNFGDYVASDFVQMRSYGMDYGSQNFHDGLVSLDFISFERCINCPEFAKKALTEGVWKKVMKYLPVSEASGHALDKP